MSDLTSRLRRLLFLVPYVARQTEGVRLSELTKALGVDREQLLADVDLLTQVGPPDGDPSEYLLVAVEEGKVFVDLPQRLTRPLRLTPAEGCSLLLGLRALRRSGIAPYDEALRSAESKLLEALGADARAAVEMADTTVVDGAHRLESQHLRTLLQASRYHKAVVIEYTAVSSGRVERRGVEPYGIVHHGGAWYVVGRCRTKNDTRTFRVDRIVRLYTTEEMFEVPSDFDLETYRRERIYVPSAEAVTVRVQLDALATARVGAAWPAGPRKKLPDGGREIAIECEGLEWVLGWVLGFGRHAKIIAPGEAKQALVQRVKEMKAQS